MYTSEEMFVFSFLGAYVGVICLLAVAAAVLTLVANWRIYAKAGKPGWKCLIPIYNIYVLFDIAWEVKQFWIYVGMWVAYYVFMMLSVMSAFFTIFTLAAGIAMLVWSIRLMNRLSACFGHGPWFTVGLILLNTIFVLILGFEKSEYRKPSVKDAEGTKETCEDENSEISEEDDESESDDEEFE